jgi:serralysin
MANLRIQFVDDPDADLRIAFVQGDGSWSYLGTMCHQIPDPEPTMNYGWLTPDSSDDELHRVVAHEFGHALGLIHEHQNPDTPIDWNRAAVIADLSGPPNNWDEATIENNMFKRYDPDEVSTTPTDRMSIMMYPIPASWTNDGFSAELNKDLSETDKEFIRNAYPW